VGSIEPTGSFQKHCALLVEIKIKSQSLRELPDKVLIKGNSFRFIS